MDQKSNPYQSVFSTSQAPNLFQLFEQIATQANDETAYRYVKTLLEGGKVDLKISANDDPSNYLEIDTSDNTNNNTGTQICLATYLLLPGIIALHDEDYNNTRHIEKIQTILDLVIENLDQEYLINILAPNILQFHREMDNEILAAYAIEAINMRCNTTFTLHAHNTNLESCNSSYLKHF